MKKIYKVFTIVLLLSSILLLTSFKTWQVRAEPPKVKDLSNIVLPSYKLPPDTKVTREEEIKKLSERIEMCKGGKIPWDSRFPDGPIPTRVQVIVIPYGEYTRIFFNNEEGSAGIPKDKLYILVGIDIAKPLKQAVVDMHVPPSQMELWEQTGALDSNKPFINQELFLIDPMTSTVVEHGFYQGRFIFPKQS